MQTVTLAQFIKQWSTPGDVWPIPADDDSILYRARDESLVLYIGISLRGINLRLREHFGLSRHIPSAFGQLFERMLPASVEWSVDMFTTKELRKYVRRERGYHAGWSRKDVAQVAEQMMITRDRPCINIHGNLNPNGLPERYRMR